MDLRDALTQIAEIRQQVAQTATFRGYRALPIALSLVASFLGRWPFGGNQHMVFAAPAVLLLAAEGIAAVAESAPRPAVVADDEWDVPTFLRKQTD